MDPSLKESLADVFFSPNNFTTASINALDKCCDRVCFSHQLVEGKACVSSKSCMEFELVLIMAGREDCILPESVIYAMERKKMPHTFFKIVVQSDKFGETLFFLLCMGRFSKQIGFLVEY
ncbi:uncharacterized protein LOC129288755 [Prosopis cineraria]|uniref:uncharacterized protein LOC129288755 n=1 Tax=Prosopis cineraria TaxID=364024 RepID=UPI0024102204|nr:uncharacterized protein LOC129288755 [Prosopis cineraria]